MKIVELRQYTLAPGRRDELIDLFEAQLIEPQEDCGIRVVGTFRDLDDAQRFVWIRSFPDMERRAESLAAFYGGPAWRRHRQAANATMIDSDNVLLLRPAGEQGGFAPASDLGPPEAEPGVVQIAIVPFAEPVSEAGIAYFADAVAPLVEASGSSVFACLVTEHAANTFPALPVREGENVLVWCAGSVEVSAPQRGARTSAEVRRALAQWPGICGEVELLTLAPTRRSRLTGGSRTYFMPPTPARP